MSHTIRLVGPTQRDYAKRLIDNSPADYVMKLGEETRTDEQNRLMWPLIKDMRDQIPGMAKFSADDTKLRFLHALGSELRHLPDLEETGFFPVGQRSSLLSKSQFSALIEIMFAWGARHNVEWSRKSEETRAAVREAQSPRKAHHSD